MDAKTIASSILTLIAGVGVFLICVLAIVVSILA